MRGLLAAPLVLAVLAIGSPDAGGSPSVRGPIDWVAWAPGPTILFHGNVTVYSIRGDGSGLRRLMTGRAFNPVWSPTGQAIALGSGEGTGVFVARPDGSGLTRIRRAGAYPAWSPRGDRIAFTTFHGIWVMAKDGSAPVKLATLFRPVYPDRGPAWSPEGDRIAFTRCLRRVSEDELCQSVRNGSAVFTIGARRSLAMRRVGRTTGWCEAWAPSRKLAFNSPLGIAVADPGRSGARVVERRPVGCAAWSPDGRFLAVERARSLVVVRARDGRARELATFPPPPPDVDVFTAPAPAWSPDGRSIVLSRAVGDVERGIAYRLYVVRMRDGRSRIVVRTSRER